MDLAATDTETWLERNTGWCERLRARVTPQQCKENMKRGKWHGEMEPLYLPCVKCPGITPGQIMEKSTKKEPKNMGKLIYCQLCKGQRKNFCRGLCQSCYNWALKRGLEENYNKKDAKIVPDDEIEHKNNERKQESNIADYKGKKLIYCVNKDCQKVTQNYGRGLCKNCYLYFRKEGKLGDFDLSMAEIYQENEDTSEEYSEPEPISSKEQRYQEENDPLAGAEMLSKSKNVSDRSIASLAKDKNSLYFNIVSLEEFGILDYAFGAYLKKDGRVFVHLHNEQHSGSFKLSKKSKNHADSVTISFKQAKRFFDIGDGVQIFTVKGTSRKDVLELVPEG